MELVSNFSKNDQWLREKERKYKDLNEHIVSVCHKYGLDEKTSIKKQTIMADKSHKLAFCRNAKVGKYCLMINNSFHFKISVFCLISQRKTKNQSIQKCPKIKQLVFNEFWSVLRCF